MGLGVAWGPGSGFSSNCSSLPNTVAGTSRGRSPLVFIPETEWDDLSWFTKGASVLGEQVVLSDSKLEVEIVGVVAGSGVPTGVEGDDVVMVNAPARTSLESVNYELKDLLSIIFKEELTDKGWQSLIGHIVMWFEVYKKLPSIDALRGLFGLCYTGTSGQFYTYMDNLVYFGIPYRDFSR
ncbi:hypothetical protein FNV43_RR04495 [Rhamnella rubrinervis]|uniref:Uncharacterized protein n=1 Tax=Rhamnella rubrinervis TaxID=2594499 RepID=A0A8K0HM13_9ROSA|nr:hypothetical protein FNV43_RR04495 [Rhamnella rubrinervis]